MEVFSQGTSHCDKDKCQFFVIILPGEFHRKKSTLSALSNSNNVL